MGPPQGMILAPFLLTLYPADCTHNIVLWLLLSCLPHYRLGQQGVQRTDPGLCELVPVELPLDECRENQRAGDGLPQVQTLYYTSKHLGIGNWDAEILQISGFHLNDKMDWSDNMDTQYKIPEQTICRGNWGLFEFKGHSWGHYWLFGGISHLLRSGLLGHLDCKQEET